MLAATHARDHVARLSALEISARVAFSGDNILREER
jgi:hypothetical protein